MATAAAPLELVLVSFPKNRFRGEILAALGKLVKDKIIRVIDVILVTKDKSGNVAVLELSDLAEEEYKAFEPVVSETRGLLSEKDAKTLSKSMENDSSAGLMLFEDTWAKELSHAIDRAGGEVVINERIPKAALEELAESTK